MENVKSDLERDLVKDELKMTAGKSGKPEFEVVSVDDVKLGSVLIMAIISEKRS